MTSENKVRSEMKNYWRKHSTHANSNEMMLDENAETLELLEIPEVLAQLPEHGGMSVLELGAGIGRFTGHIAKDAKDVIAIDFMEKFTQKNKETNGHHGNIDFRCLDVTKLELPPRSVDMIFSNWLFMYLTDEEVQRVFNKALSWLREDGYFFIRESCYHQSGSKSRGDVNPTQYRAPEVYTRMAESAHSTPYPGHFELLSQRPMQTYIQLKNNPNQICWLFKRVSPDAPAQEDRHR